MTHVDAAVAALLDAGPRPGSVVVGKSTVPAGTAARLESWITAAAPGVGLAWNPEFLREGFAVDDTLSPDRLVFGVPRGSDAGRVEEILRRVYSRPIDAGTRWW
jgi:UDPglucose 6-dehydrogenase